MTLSSLSSTHAQFNGWNPASPTFKRCVAEAAKINNMTEPEVASIMLSFPQVVVDATRRDSLTTIDSAVHSCIHYAQHFIDIPGAPQPSMTTIADALAIPWCNLFNAEAHLDWDGFRRFVSDHHQAERLAFNPYLPIWTCKTDDQETPWIRHSRWVPEDLRHTLNGLIIAASPTTATDDTLFASDPLTDPITMAAVVTAMTHCPSLFFWRNGDPANADWCWGPSLVLLAGLGIDAAQMFLGSQTHIEGIDYFATCSHQDFADTVKSMRSATGFGAGILRIDVTQLLVHGDRVNEEDADGNPYWSRWVEALLALHVLKHLRLFRSGATNCIQAAFRGRSTVLEVPEQHLQVSLNSKCVRSLLTDLLSVLGLPTINAKNEDSFFIRHLTHVLQYLKPINLPRALNPSSLPYLTVAPGVSISSQVDLGLQRPWVNPGISISNAAILNPETGQVEHPTPELGSLALSIRWPTAEMSATELANWSSIIPACVAEEDPAAFLSRYVKNRNTLGHSNGANAVLNAAILGDMARAMLGGSAVGAALANELPPFFFLPMGHTREDTTNQGKTLAARIIGGAIAPGVEVVAFAGGNGAPAQRQMAEQLYTHGTSIYDEFIMPTDPMHFLAKEGIQSSATGGRLAPGRVMANGLGPRLLHPLLFVCKLAAIPEDIYNRVAMVFLDTLTKESRLTNDDLAAIMTGKVSMEMRFTAARYLLRSGILNKLRSSKLSSGEVWRFNGHMTIARMFASDDEIQGYLTAAREHAKRQVGLASISGLGDDLGVHTFDPQAMFFQMPSDELVRAKNVPKRARDLLLLLFGRVEMRELDNELRAMRTTMRSAETRIASALRKAPFVRDDGITLRAVTETDNQRTRITYIVTCTDHA